MPEKIIYRAEFFREGDVYVGLCPKLNVSSFGENITLKRIESFYNDYII